MDRASQRWAARTVVLVLTLLGLVAMHGLPDAMAGPDGDVAMAAGVAMPSPVVTLMTTTRPAPMRVAAGARSSIDQAAPSTPLSPATAALTVSAPAGCGMDHAECVAVLPDAGHLVAAVSALSGWRIAGTAEPSPVTVAPRGPRAPPDVSLIGLGISRT